MPRKKSTDKIKIEKLKKDLKECVDDKKHRTYFWATSGMYCPHCKKPFMYKEMWQALVRDFKTIEAIMEVVDRSWSSVQHHLTNYKLRGGILRTKENVNWHRKAEAMGYDSPEQLFFDLKVNRGFSWKKISLHCGNIGKEEAEIACKMFLDVSKKSKRKEVKLNGKKEKGS